MNKRACAWLVAWMVTCLTSTAGAAHEPSGASPAIVGGTRDTNDTSVVMILAQKPPGSEKDCSGFVVSPHVVVTAAHCLDPAVLGGDGFTFYVYIGDDLDDPAQSMVGTNYIRVQETHFDPAFSTAQMGGGHDIGVIVTKTPIGRAAIPLRTSALGMDLVGAPVRLVGFGKRVPDDPASYGMRYQTSSTIGLIYEREVATVAGPPGGCQGDSGSPLLLNVGGTDVAIGVSSWGEHDATCSGTNNYTRVDQLRAFVVPFVTAADPDFVLPTEPPQSAQPDAAVNDGGVLPGSSSGGCTVGSSGSRRSTSPPQVACALCLFVLACSALRTRARAASRHGQGLQVSSQPSPSVSTAV